LNRTTHHVKWQKIKSPNGFTLSNANPNMMFHGSIPNSSHFSHVILTPRIQINPFVLAPCLCQINNSANDLHLYFIIVLESKGSVKALSMEHIVIHPQTWKYYTLDTLLNPSRSFKKTHNHWCTCEWNHNLNQVL